MGSEQGVWDPSSTQPGPAAWPRARQSRTNLRRRDAWQGRRSLHPKFLPVPSTISPLFHPPPRPAAVLLVRVLVNQLLLYC
jgi:hypothetical protein